jgi:2-alkenal reductase
MLAAAGGALIMDTRVRTQAPAPAPVATVSQMSPASQPAPIVIAPPEEGMDYESAVLANVYEQVNPSVVNIAILANPHNSLPADEIPDGIDPDEFFVVSSGSGFVWDMEGHIVTNNHVVADADLIQVTFSDGTAAIAELVGTDVDSDLAVIKIDPVGYVLKPIRVGDMNDVYVGMRVVAIGNPFGLEGSLTSGIVSALGRSIPARASFNIPGSIQTDAAINPGNSGGPLLNEQGELVGVNAQIRSEERANSGVGFAIPVNIVNRVAPALIADGEYAHAYMGISGLTFNPICSDELELDKSVRGAIVVDVLRNTPAARAGLRAGRSAIDTDYPQLCPPRSGGDLIIAINGQPVSKFDDVLFYLSGNASPGDTITLTVLRNGEERTIDLTLAPRPDRL